MKYYKLKDSVGRGDYPEYKRDRSYCETEKIREGGITVGELALTYPSDWEEVEGPETITTNTDVPADTGRTEQAKKHYDRGFQDGMKKALESPLRMVVVRPMSGDQQTLLHMIMPIVQHSNSLEEMWKTISDPSFIESPELRRTLLDQMKEGGVITVRVYERGDDSIDFMSVNDVVFRVEQKRK